MGRNVHRAIDSIIEKKLRSGKNKLNDGIKALHRYTKLIGSKKYETYKSCFQYEGLLDDQIAIATLQRVDLYDNKFYNFYENKVKKTRCKFNLLRLFKPGELLTSIASLK